MAEGVGFPFPSLPLNEGRTYGQPEVVLISLPQVATGLRLRLPGSSVAGLSARPAHAAGGTLVQRAFRQLHSCKNQKKMLSEINAGYGRKGESYHGDISLYSKDCRAQ